MKTNFKAMDISFNITVTTKAFVLQYIFNYVPLFDISRKNIYSKNVISQWKVCN